MFKISTRECDYSHRKVNILDRFRLLFLTKHYRLNPDNKTFTEIWFSKRYTYIGDRIDKATYLKRLRGF